MEGREIPICSCQMCFVIDNPGESGDRARENTIQYYGTHVASSGPLFDVNCIFS